MTDKITQTDHDPFILGGHTFTSRFILGSGKSSPWPCAGQMKEGLQTYWTIYRGM